MMGPSCRRKPSSRRKTLFNHSKNQQNSVLSQAANIICDPAMPANCSTKVDVSKDVENVGMSYNSACSTPKAKRFRIPEINTCPPAPKKRRIVLRNCSLRRTSPVPFFAPPDIELFFYFALRGIIPV